MFDILKLVAKIINNVLIILWENIKFADNKLDYFNQYYNY